MYALLLASLIAAAPSKPARTVGNKVAHPDFSIPDLPALPTGSDLHSTRDSAPAIRTHAPADPTQQHYTLTGLEHAQQFVLQTGHYEARHPIDKLDVVNLPMTVASFHTLVRVHSASHLGASIGVRLLDPRGNQVLSSQGALVFGGHDDAEFLIDWDPFTLSKSGRYTFEVTVAGQVVGTQPFMVVQELNATLVATPTPDAGSAPALDAGAAETWP